MLFFVKIQQLFTILSIIHLRKKTIADRFFFKKK